NDNPLHSSLRCPEETDSEGRGNVGRGETSAHCERSCDLVGAACERHVEGRASSRERYVVHRDGAIRSTLKRTVDDNGSRCVLVRLGNDIERGRPCRRYLTERKETGVECENRRLNGATSRVDVQREDDVLG